MNKPLPPSPAGTPPRSLLRRQLASRLLLAAALPLAGCVVVPLRDPLRVQVVGIEPLPGAGLEWRFGVKLRLLNPNDAELDYSGVFLELDVGGKPLGSGISDVKGRLTPFGETQLFVPVTVTALDALRQALRVVEGKDGRRLDYVLRGKVGVGGVLGERRFETRGELTLPASMR